MRLQSMKIILTAATAVFTLASIAPSASANMHQSMYQVDLNKTRIVHLSQPAGAIVVGNPEIADVSVHSSDTLFLVGRGYGQTNILILNSAGETVMDADIQVTNTLPKNGVRLYKGGNQRQTYSCAPYCQPAPVLGDDNRFVGNNTKGAESIDNQIATSAFGLSANGQQVSMAPNQ